MTKPARGRGGIRRSHVSPPDSVRGEPARASCKTKVGPRINQKGDFRGAAARGGEGGIRTLEAGISPPNALAGRRLQPLGHFSRARIVSQHFGRESPRVAGFRLKRRERDLNPRCTFQHIRDFQSRSFGRSDTPPGLSMIVNGAEGIVPAGRRWRVRGSRHRGSRRHREEDREWPTRRRATRRSRSSTTARRA